MATVLDFKKHRNQQHDQEIVQWLLKGGMPKFIVELLTAAIIDMRRLVKHPAPEEGVFSAIQFRRRALEEVDVWQIGRHDIFPIQFIYDLPYGSDGIEHLYHSNDHEFVFGTYSTTDATQVIGALVREFQRKKKLLEGDAVSPLLYFLNSAIARSFELVQPSLVMGGYSEKASAFMLHMQNHRVSAHFTLYYDEFLSIPLDPPRTPSEA